MTRTTCDNCGQILVGKTSARAKFDSDCGQIATREECAVLPTQQQYIEESLTLDDWRGWERGEVTPHLEMLCETAGITNLTLSYAGAVPPESASQIHVEVLS